jgi:hypothetical protein
MYVICKPGKAGPPRAGRPPGRVKNERFSLSSPPLASDAGREVTQGEGRLRYS